MTLHLGRDKAVYVRQDRLYIRTDLDPDELRAKLRQWEPWRHEIHFSNGVKTTDLKTATPFARFPLSKWFIFTKHLGRDFTGGRALDIGFNCGYNALYLCQEYDMDVVGIDVSPRHVKVAEFLRSLTGLQRLSFELNDANTYRADAPFDLVLHFGTLYHLRHPFLSLENTAHNLKPGGMLALETQTYNDDDRRNTCLFVADEHMGDSSNWWMLGQNAIIGMLRACGLVDVQVVFSWTKPEVLGGAEFARTCFVARKPA